MSFIQGPCSLTVYLALGQTSFHVVTLVHCAVCLLVSHCVCHGGMARLSCVFTSAKEVMFLLDFVCLFVCLPVCEQDNSKNYGRIFLKFWGYVGHGINYQWFNFGRDPAGILDSGSLWNFRYHCIKGGIREPLAKRRWWRHLANSFALAEVPAGYDCFSSL